MENPEIFKTIDSQEPDLFVWLGDVVYADKMVGPLIFQPRDPVSWRKKFTDMKDREGYVQLRQNRRIVGIWDDHDYGQNGGNKHHPYKELARQIFLEFLDEKPDSPRWTRAGGIYESYTVDAPDGSGRQVKVILLDIRFSADEWTADGDCIGEEQWAWLENELKTPGDLTLIGSGVQVMVEDRFGVTEKWHPKSRERLYALLVAVPNVVLLTGDVHMSEIMLNPCLQYPLYEVTSSGMTHTVQTTFGFMHNIFTHMLMPYTYNIGHRVTVKNYALLTVDWSAADPLVTITIHDTYGAPQLSHSFGLSSLSQPSTPSDVCLVSPMKRYLVNALHSVLVYVVPVLLLVAVVRLVNSRRHKPKQS
jgi:alkaline phosphatase D